MGVAVNIEIKPTPGRERETGAAIALDAKALWMNANVQPLLSSFSEAALDGARDAAAELPRAYLAEQLPDDWRERIVRIGCVAIDLRHTLLTRERVDEFHATGLRVATWTANEPARVADLLAWGADTVITDAVDVIPPEPQTEYDKHGLSGTGPHSPNECADVQSLKHSGPENDDSARLAPRRNSHRSVRGQHRAAASTSF